jgi:hypothetical protein
MLYKRPIFTQGNEQTVNDIKRYYLLYQCFMQR